MKSNKIAPCGLGAVLQAYIKVRPLLAQHPPHRSECPYLWIGLKMKMPMSTPLWITLLFFLKSVVLLPRKALWCVSLCNSVISMDVAEISPFSLIHKFSGADCCCQTVGWCWAYGEISWYCCSRRHGSHGEAWITSRTRRVKEVEGITPDELREILGYLNGTKSTLPGLKKIIKDLKKAQMWSRHILHPEAVANGLVNNSRGMSWSNTGFYLNKLTDLAEISASLCVVELMHNRIPLCDTTCLQLHLVLSRWPQGSALLHHT